MPLTKFSSLQVGQMSARSTISTSQTKPRGELIAAEKASLDNMWSKSGLCMATFTSIYYVIKRLNILANSKILQGLLNSKQMYFPESHPVRNIEFVAILPFINIWGLYMY